MSDVLVHQPSLKTVPVQPCRHSCRLGMSPTSPCSCFPVFGTRMAWKSILEVGTRLRESSDYHWWAVWLDALGQGVWPQKGLSYVTIHLTPDRSCPGELWFLPHLLKNVWGSRRSRGIVGPLQKIALGPYVALVATLTTVIVCVCSFVQSRQRTERRTGMCELRDKWMKRHIYSLYYTHITQTVVHITYAFIAHILFAVMLASDCVLI